MKKIIYIILLFVIVYPYPTKAQDRNVYWVHGLEGNIHTMHVWSETYPIERKIAPGNKPAYSTKNGIKAAADELYSKMPNKGSNTIVVAQSMGGLNSLQIFKDHGTAAFGGLITTGTAFEGVPIAKNADEPVFNNLVNDIINEGIPGAKVYFVLASTFWDPITGIINYFWGTNFSTIENGMNGMVNKLQELMSNYFFGNDKTKADLRPDSPIIRDLQNINLQNIPRVAIWGNEDDPKVLRLIGTVREKQKSNGTLGLGELGDQGAIEVVDLIASTFENANRICKIMGYTTLGDPPLAASLFYAASQLNNSTDYWRNRLEPGLEQLTGCFKTEERIQTYQDWVCDDLPYKTLKSTNILQNCHWETKTRTVYVTVPTLNDGIIPDFSAKAMPGVQSQCILEAKHINHMQLTNSNEVKGLFDQVFKGEVVDSRKNNFFIIPKR